MHTGLVKRLLLPAHERLFGRRTFACLAELERVQWLPPDEIRRLQSRKLRDLLLHADCNLPFYRSRFRAAGLDPTRITDPASLRSLPILTKTDIRANIDAMVCRSVPGGPHRGNTGGSTGEPLHFYLDRRRQAWDQAARMLTHRWFGAEVGEREVYLWGAPAELRRQDRLRAWRDRLTNQLLLSAFDLSSRRIEQYLRRIERFEPTAIFGYPSTLAYLAREALRRGWQLSAPQLRCVFVTGETLVPPDRSDIAAFFGVPVANGYGSRDGGFIAHECPQGSLHVIDHNVGVEVVDSDGNAAAPGELGRLIVTQLDNYAMPLIRYDTGDLARAGHSDRRCDCGRGFSPLLSVEGRATDLLVAPDGTVRHALAAIYVLREEPLIERYRIVQHTDCSLTVEVVCSRGLEDPVRLRLIAGLHQRLGSDLSIRLVRVRRIGTASSGKTRPVVSHVSKGRLPRDVAACPRGDPDHGCTANTERHTAADCGALATIGFGH